MKTIFELEVNKNAEIAYEEKKYSLSLIIVLLLSRVILFLIFQFLFFIVFAICNVQSPWQQSANWWPFVVIITNLVCVLLIHILLKREKKSFCDFFIFIKGKVIKDYLMMSGLLIISFPFAYLPNTVLGNILFGNYMEAINLFYRPLPLWAAWTALILFPITMSLGELTTYYGYVMPRLEIITRNKWLSLTLPAIMLSFQHITLPLLFDVRFIIWRLLMFLPFAFIIGLIFKWRPRLFPYILIGHFFIDVMTAVSILLISMSK